MPARLRGQVARACRLRPRSRSATAGCHRHLINAFFAHRPPRRPRMRPAPARPRHLPRPGSLFAAQAAARASEPGSAIAACLGARRSVGVVPAGAGLIRGRLGGRWAKKVLMRRRRRSAVVDRDRGRRTRVPRPRCRSGLRLRLPRPRCRSGLRLRLPRPRCRSGLRLRLPRPRCCSGLRLRVALPSPTRRQANAARSAVDRARTPRG